MKYVCNACGYVYDPELGDPDGGVAPGPNDRARVDRGGTEMTLDSTILVNEFLFGVDEMPQLFTFLPTGSQT